MEPLRLLFGLLFAVMSVGVLVFPVSWPFSKDDTATPSTKEAPALEASLSSVSSTEAYLSDVKLAEIPSDTILSIRPITDEKDLADQLTMAKYFAAEKQFDEALDVLASLTVYDQDRYEVVFLRARILSWSGRHHAAEQKFQRLMTKYPGDTDLMVSYGYLQFYQGKVVEAEKSFLDVLEINPDYVGAQNGLFKVRKAM